MKKENLCLTIGMILSVITFKYFLIPSGINIGGFAGISQILNKIFNIPYIASTICMNGILYLWGSHCKGFKFVARSIFATILFSFLLDIIPLFGYTEYPLWITSIIASIGAGCGFGLILSANASTGGSDLLAAIIAEYFPKISIGNAMIITNLTIISVTGFMTGFIYGRDLFIISIITTVLSNILIDVVYCIGTHKPLPKYINDLYSKIQLIISKKSLKSDNNPNFSLTKAPKEGDTITVELNNLKITILVVNIDTQ